MREWGAEKMDEDMAVQLSCPVVRKLDMDAMAELLESSMEMDRIDLGGSSVHLVRHPLYGSLALVSTPSGECAAIRSTD